MLSKSLKFSTADAENLRVCVQKDMQSTGPSETIKNAYEDLAVYEPNDWKLVSAEYEKLKKSAKCTENELVTRSFSVSEDDYRIVKESICKGLGLTKPKISFVTRMVLTAQRMRFEERLECTEKRIEKPVKIEVTEVSVAELCFEAHKKALQLAKEGKVDIIQKFIKS